MLYPCICYLHCCINSHYSYDETFHGIYGQEMHAAAASGWQQVQQVTGERRAYLDQGKDVLQVVLDVMLDNGDDDTQLLKEELKHTHSHGSQCTATGPSRWARLAGSHFTASVGLLQDPASTSNLTSPFNTHPSQPIQHPPWPAHSTPTLTSPFNTHPNQPVQHPP